MPPKMATARQTQADMYAMKTAIAREPMPMIGGWSGGNTILCSAAPESVSFSAKKLGIGN